MTVTSTESNESQGQVEVKIPASSTSNNEPTSKAVHLIDIPGHFHFKDKLQNTFEQSKSIIVVVDSKDK